MKIIVVEGTPEELKSLPELTRMLGPAMPLTGGLQSPSQPEAEIIAQAPDSSITPELVKKALVRKALPDTQKGLITAVCRAPDWISKDEMLAQADITESSLPGVLGGLGLRLGKTPRWPKRKHAGRPIRLLIDEEKRNGNVYYRATEVLRQGARLAGVF